MDISAHYKIVLGLSLLRQCHHPDRLDYCVGDPGSISAGAEFPTGIQFWMIA